MSRSERREQFVDAAITAIRRDGPSVSMADIAREAGVSKPILYRHVGDRAGLYAAMAERFVAESLVSDPPLALRGRPLVAATIDAFLQFVEREPELYRFLREAASEDTPMGFVRAVGAQVTGVLQAFGCPPSVAPVWGQAVAGAVASVAAWWAEDGGQERRALARYLTDLVWGGLATVSRAWQTPGREPPRA